MKVSKASNRGSQNTAFRTNLKSFISLAALFVIAVALSVSALIFPTRLLGASDSSMTTEPPQDKESVQAKRGPELHDGGQAGPAERFLAVSDDSLSLVRAESSGCGTDEVAIEVSDDNANTWTPAEYSDISVMGIRQLSFGNGGHVQLTYSDQDCELQTARSYVYGRAWEEGALIPGVWSSDEELAPNQFLVGEHVAEAPCNAKKVSGAADRGMVLCDDDTVASSEDGGETWSSLVRAPGARSIVSTSDRFVIVAVGESGCTGVTAREFDGVTVGPEGECGVSDPDVGEVATAYGGGRLFVWAGDEIVKSDDDGATWEL